MDHDPMTRLEQLAASQGSLFTRSQAYACGGPNRTVERRISTGRWVPVGRDVLRVAAVPITDALRLRAATLSLRGAVVAHEWPGGTTASATSAGPV